MNHRTAASKEGTTAVVASLISTIFSFIASSHHWLHAVIMLFIGSSTNMVATMSSMLWLRRTMFLITIFSVIYSLYRLRQHKRMPYWIKGLTIMSIIISIGLIAYTIHIFGW